MRYSRVKMARAVRTMGAMIGSHSDITCRNEGDCTPEYSLAEYGEAFEGTVTRSYLRPGLLHIVLRIHRGRRLASPYIWKIPPPQFGVVLGSCTDSRVHLRHGRGMLLNGNRVALTVIEWRTV